MHFHFWLVVFEIKTTIQKKKELILNKSLFCATKSGDFHRVIYLVEVEDENLNKKNQWDSILSILF